MDALEDDGEQAHSNQNKLQRIVNEGLTSAVRAGDFNTSRQVSPNNTSSLCPLEEPLPLSNGSILLAPYSLYTCSFKTFQAMQ